MRGEFGFLQDLKNHFNLSKIGDDCAVIPKDDCHDFLITSDLLVEDIDFRLQWIEPKHLGHKALTVSLSDVAAMGGTPVFSMLSIGITNQLWTDEFLTKFYEGYHSLARSLNVELIGGDLSRTDGPLVVDSTLIGTVPKGKAINRSGSRPGDYIYVTGPLGGAAAGLSLLEDGARLSEETVEWQASLITRQILPSFVSGVHLIDLADAMIDISDGISSDLGHLCNASGVGARIYSDQLPIHPELSNLFETREDEVKFALNGGEDYELLFTVAPGRAPECDSIAYFRIGEITDDRGQLELVTNGIAEKLEPLGFTHFAP